MDLKSMLKREDFFPIFFSTIKHYYKEVHGVKIEIDFSTKKDCNLVIKPFLSAAVSPKLSSKARRFFYSEWNIKSSFLKFILAKIGVFVLTHSRKSFAIYKFKVYPENVLDENIVIAPNNRSIRIFNYNENKVGCIIKEGFTHKYFDNQLNFRLNHNYDFILPLIKYGKSWFIEPIMVGHPLARVTDRIHFEDGKKEALKDISLLANDTLELIDAESYVSTLQTKINGLVKKAIISKNIMKGQATLSIINNLKFDFRTFKEIPICDSHGDFQEGNIWLDNNHKVWIYDWETVDKRSVWYDTSVLLFSLRNNFGWKKFFNIEQPVEILNCDKRKQYSNNDFINIRNIILLEDIVFYLEDMLELPSYWGNDIYDNFINRIEKYIV